MKKGTRLFFLFTTDLVLTALALCVFSLFHHVLPRSIGHLYGSTATPGEIADWKEKFPDKFTDGEVIETDTSYRDDEVNITLTTYVEDGVTYTVADLYLRRITSLRTAMAGSEFATGVADSTLNLSREAGALFAVSGDYFGIRQRSIVIRNGEVYRKTPAHAYICVLYYDGTMETYTFGEFDVDRAIAGGAWQAWDFGPALLDEKGAAVTDFDTGIAGENPRIGLGYYEPGHYAVVAVDGRQAHSRGMTLPEFAALFQRLGCKTAYNLDGGNSAAMTWRGEMFSSPSKEKEGRDISDIIYLCPKRYQEGVSTP